VRYGAPGLREIEIHKTEIVGILGVAKVSTEETLEQVTVLSEDVRSGPGRLLEQITPEDHQQVHDLMLENELKAVHPVGTANTGEASKLFAASTRQSGEDVGSDVDVVFTDFSELETSPTHSGVWTRE